MPLSNAEIDAVIKVLWHTHAIRFYYEDCALDSDARRWKNNGGMFTNFSRYNSQKWKDMMGEDDPTVRGRCWGQSAEARRLVAPRCAFFCRARPVLQKCHRRRVVRPGRRLASAASVRFRPTPPCPHGRDRTFEL
jgi:hypothetical protein